MLVITSSDEVHRLSPQGRYMLGWYVAGRKASLSCRRDGRLLHADAALVRRPAHASESSVAAKVSLDATYGTLPVRCDLGPAVLCVFPHSCVAIRACVYVGVGRGSGASLLSTGVGREMLCSGVGCGIAQTLLVVFCIVNWRCAAGGLMGCLHDFRFIAAWGVAC